MHIIILAGRPESTRPRDTLTPVPSEARMPRFQDSFPEAGGHDGGGGEDARGGEGAPPMVGTGVGILRPGRLPPRVRSASAFGHRMRFDEFGFGFALGTGWPTEVLFSPPEWEVLLASGMGDSNCECDH